MIAAPSVLAEAAPGASVMVPMSINDFDSGNSRKCSCRTMNCGVAVTFRLWIVFRSIAPRDVAPKLAKRLSARRRLASAVRVPCN